MSRKITVTVYYHGSASYSLDADGVAGNFAAEPTDEQIYRAIRSSASAHASDLAAASMRVHFDRAVAFAAVRAAYLASKEQP